MLIPQVRQARYTGTHLFLPYALRLQAQPEVVEKACRCASLLLEAKVVAGNEPHIIAQQADWPAEAYHLDVGDTVVVTYGDYLGLRNALATLSGLLTACEGGYTVPKGYIEDAPLASHRGIMLDIARGIRPLTDFREDILLIARARMNILHLHVLDSAGCAIALKCLPSDCVLEQHYTCEEMAEIVELCDVLGLEIVPEFDLPAHSKRLTAVFPETLCPVEGHNGGWVTCAGAEETFAIYERIIRELVEVFPGGRYFHIGGDELEMGDVPQLDDLCYWDKCPRCQQRMREEGLKDRQELYYYVILQVHKVVESLGRQMIMWSDQLDCTRSSPLPRDIIMQFWRIACQGRGPVEECSFAAQLKMGYSLINSHYLEAYIEEEGEMTEDTIRDWRWDERPTCEEAHRQQIIGGELCVWMYGITADPDWKPDDFAFINRLMPSALFLMGDKLWNGKVFTYTEEFRQKLTRAVLGSHTPKGLDLWQVFGGLIPPKSNTTLAYRDRVICSKDTAAAVLAALRAMPQTRQITIYSDAIESLINCWGNG